MQNTKVKVVSIFTWHLTPWAQVHYQVGEVVVVKYCTAIEVAIINLGATIIPTTTNV